MTRSFRVGLLTSVGGTLDAFFPEIVARWRRGGLQVFPAAGTSAFLAGTEVLPSVTRRPSIRNRSAFAELRAWTREHAIDVTVTNTATVSALARAARLECPIVYFCHGLHWASNTPRAWPWKLVERSLIRRTDGVVTLNSDDETWFRSQDPSLPMLRLEGGVGVDTARFARRPLQNSQKLVWIGEMSPRKRPFAALKVAEELARSGVEFHLCMLGDGPLLPDLRRAAERAGLLGRVSFPGHVGVVPYLEEARAIVHTAQWEGLPRALLEAAAMGRPSIAFNVKGVRDIPGVQLVGDGDVRALARLIQSHLQQDRLWTPPAPEPLSYHFAADRLAEFLTGMVCGSGPKGG